MIPRTIHRHDNCPPLIKTFSALTYKVAESLSRRSELRLAGKHAFQPLIHIGSSKTAGGKALTRPLLLGFAGLVAHNAADRCTADSSGGTAARENVTRDTSDVGADRSVILLRRHAATAAKH